MFGRIVLLVLVGIVVWAVFARASAADGPDRRYVVRPADTLWSIAERNYAGDPRAAVWELRQRNGLRGSTIAPGQVLMLP
jgi:LysM repeat protein